MKKKNNLIYTTGVMIQSHKKHQFLSLKQCFVWSSLVSLFNGISTIMDYLMPKLSLEKNISDTT